MQPPWKGRFKGQSEDYHEGLAVKSAGECFGDILEALGPSPSTENTNVTQNTKCHGIIYICKNLNIGCISIYWLENGHNRFVPPKLFRPSNSEKLFKAEEMPHSE